MASALSNRSLSFSLRPLAARSSSKTPKTLTLALPAPQIPYGKTTLSSSQLSRRPFRASLRVAETDPKTINGDEENQILANKSEEKPNQKDLPTMKSLLEAYKKAILDGDEKSVSEMEAAICIMAAEKNNLSTKCTELTAEIASGKAGFLRLKADFENFRRKTEKDRLSFTSDVQGEVVESLLAMVDSFEKAKQHFKPETEKEKKIDTSYQGIYKQFVEIMRSLRVAVIETVGKPFDPSIHEAVAREESRQFKAGVVTQELRRGFVLGDRLLRPASVKVSTGLGLGKAAVPSEEPSEQPDIAAEPVEDTASTSSIS